MLVSCCLFSIYVALHLNYVLVELHAFVVVVVLYLYHRPVYVLNGLLEVSQRCLTLAIAWSLCFCEDISRLGMSRYYYVTEVLQRFVGQHVLVFVTVTYRLFHLFPRLHLVFNLAYFFDQRQ